jgi:hypothetical protein
MILTDEVQIDAPDRHGSFEPPIVKERSGACRASTSW